MEAAAYWQSMSVPAALLNFFPFAFLLAAIAVFPFVPGVSVWWEKMSHKFYLAALCALGGGILYSYPAGDALKLGGTALEYTAFIALLGALFIISGGIHITGAFAGLPYVNTLFLGIGAVLASFLGTTGASMVLIRPLLRANRLRKHKAHIVVFFIFIVSNCGGLLTPLGDPPLYLGFLRGVPFFWTFHLVPEWAFTTFVLLFVFHLVDDRIFDREEFEMRGSLIREIKGAEKAVHVRGWMNVFYLAAVLAVVVAAGYWLTPWLGELYGERTGGILAKAAQAGTMALIALISYRTTPRKIHEDNHFSFAPLQEVAVLFFGIFGAMVPALALLEAKGKTLAIDHPWQYFWMSGLLSSFLDNAPTYLSFASLAAGHNGLSADRLGDLASGFPRFLAAVSCGSVFMGANSYIGNGPNFMVKAVAEHAGVKMPSFGGYMLWSLAVLVPVFILETFLFF